MKNNENTAVEITATAKPARSRKSKAIKRGRGRPANPAWKAVNGGMFRLMTDKQIQTKLAEAGFQTSITNIYLKRQRLAAKGKNVICPRSRVLTRSSAEMVDVAQPEAEGTAVND